MEEKPDGIIPFNNSSDYDKTGVWEIILEFHESRSSDFEYVIDLIKSNPSFQEVVIPNSSQKRYIVKFLADQTVEFITVYNVVKNWKSTTVKIYDQLIERAKLSRLLRCFGDYAKFRNPNFCFGISRFTKNIWGCHRIKIKDHWFQYVKLTTEGKILVDKEAILEEIKNDLLDYRFCPVLKPDRILKALNRLPNELRKSDWDVKPTPDGKISVWPKEKLMNQETIDGVTITYFDTEDILRKISTNESSSKGNDDRNASYKTTKSIANRKDFHPGCLAIFILVMFFLIYALGKSHHEKTDGTDDLQKQQVEKHTLHHVSKSKIGVKGTEAGNQVKAGRKGRK